MEKHTDAPKRTLQNVKILLIGLSKFWRKNAIKAAKKVGYTWLHAKDYRFEKHERYIYFDNLKNIFTGVSDSSPDYETLTLPADWDKFLKCIGAEVCYEAQYMVLQKELKKPEYLQLIPHKDYEKWLEINEIELKCIFAETGADRELDFNQGLEEANLYFNDLRNILMVEAQKAREETVHYQQKYADLRLKLQEQSEPLPLNNKQIKMVYDWMNTWDHLKTCVIPLRFKEHFKSKQ